MFVQIAIIDVLKELGIAFDGIIGFSSGDIAAGYADGTLTHEQSLLIARGVEVAMSNSGLPELKMAIVGMSWEEAKADRPQGISLAIQNSPNAVTITGYADVMDTYLATLTARGIFTVELATGGHGGHTPLAEPNRKQLCDSLRDVLPVPVPKTERWVNKRDEAEYISGPVGLEYFFDIWAKPFLFHDCLKKIPSGSLVLEVGRKPVLQSFLTASLGSSRTRLTVTPSSGDKLKHFIDVVGQLHLAGFSPQVNIIYPPIKLPILMTTQLPSPISQEAQEAGSVNLKNVTKLKIQSQSLHGKLFLLIGNTTCSSLSRRRFAQSKQPPKFNWTEWVGNFTRRVFLDPNFGSVW